MSESLAQLANGALRDLADVFAAMPEDALDGLIEATLVEIARKGGARTALVTAQPAGGLAKRVDIITIIPAQTMANDKGGKLSVLPMGSLFETAQMIALELVILKLRPRFNETSESMRARHTNLE
jgi:6-phospho-3-hexuloisomerase